MSAPALSQDALDAAAAAVMRRHPDLTGEAFDRKVRLVAAIMAHVHDGPTWTAGRGRAGRANA